jgi:hypothetical protein
LDYESDELWPYQLWLGDLLLNGLKERVLVVFLLAACILAFSRCLLSFLGVTDVLHKYLQERKPQLVNQLKATLLHLLLRCHLLEGKLFFILSRVEVDVLKGLVKAQSALQLLHLEGVDAEVVIEVVEELPNVQQLLKGVSINQNLLWVGLLRESVSSMQIRHLLDQLVLNGILDGVLVDKLRVVVREYLEELLDLVAPGLLCLLSFRLFIFPLV